MRWTLSGVRVSSRFRVFFWFCGIIMELYIGGMSFMGRCSGYIRLM